ncbi:MAG: hypothetical protein P4L16_07255 [Chlamydiales bacterium]|nr:hypothetical protein [Chlamydiales bacterium]
MEIKGFSVGESIKFGWNKMKEHFWFFVGFILLASISLIIPFGISAYFDAHQYPLLRILFLVIYFILALVVNMGFIKASLAVKDQNKAKISNLYSCFPLFFKFLIAHILYMLIIAAGLILLVFPAVIWATRYGFYGYLIVDQKLGPIKALKMSAKITMGVKWDLFALYAVLYIIGVIGVLCLGIGMFATVPLTILATAWVYRNLQSVKAL